MPTPTALVREGDREIFPGLAGVRDLVGTMVGATGAAFKGEAVTVVGRACFTGVGGCRGDGRGKLARVSTSGAKRQTRVQTSKTRCEGK